MSDLDDGTFYPASSNGGGGGVDLDAMARMNDDEDQHEQFDDHLGTDGEGIEEAPEQPEEGEDSRFDNPDGGFSSEDDLGGGAGGDYGGSMSGVDGATDGMDSMHIGDEDLLSSGPEHAAEIRAPGGSNDATASAAARLASVMAKSDDPDDHHEEDGEYADHMDLEARERRKREVAAAEAALGNSKRASRTSASASHRSGGGYEEEKEMSSRSGAGHSGRSSFPAPHSDRRVFDDGPGGDLLEDDFDDDDGGEYSDREYGSDLSADEDQQDQESEDDERTLEDIARAKEEREHLIEVNKIRQRQIALILEREKAAHGGKPSRGGVHTSDDKSSFDGSGVGGVNQLAHPEQIRSEYIKNLESLNILWDTLESKREEAEDKIDRLTSKLDQYDERATELSDSFKSFKREISKDAKFSRTGKPIKLKRILAFESAEEMKDREVARVRLRHINLLNELRTLEDAVRVKEKLAEGLHLIDFEQLKIENQTLNEKIEERNDELHKLKKKTTTTVQVLTHIKEKLQFVKEENQYSQNELRTINMVVQNLRDQLTRMKHARDEARNENSILKQKQGFIGSDLLVSDFENRKGDIDVLRSKVESLKQKWRNLNSLSLKANTLERAHARAENVATLQRQSQYATVKFAGQNGANLGGQTAQGSALRR